MSTFRSVLRLMVLAGVCILSGTTTAEANPRRVYQPVITYYYPVVPSYSSGVYLYSQYPTVPDITPRIQLMTIPRPQLPRSITAGRTSTVPGAGAGTTQRTRTMATDPTVTSASASSRAAGFPSIGFPTGARPCMASLPT